MRICIDALTYIDKYSMLSYSRNLEVGSMGIGAGFCMYDVVVKKFTFAISSPDKFLSICKIDAGEF